MTDSEAISDLHGRQVAQSLVLELLLLHNPQTLQALRAIPPERFEALLEARPVDDRAIRSALDQLRLLRDAGTLHADG